MKKLRILILPMILVCLCCGCTNYAEEYSQNTLIVKGNGSLVEVSVDNYKDTNIKAEELNQYIDDQISTYNEENGKGSVKKKKLLMEDMSEIKLVMTYKNIDCYNGFNSYECVLANYEEVDKALLSGAFTDMDGKAVKKDEFKDVEKAKVLVVSEPIDVVINKDVLYYNKNVSIKKGVITTTGKGNGVIIYK
ncbi:MAG: hypothetical protein ACI4F4_07750 [Lachnospiraceae bacterium]